MKRVYLFILGIYIIFLPGILSSPSLSLRRCKSSTSINVDPTIFRSYDIRGYTEGENANLTPEVAREIAKALGSVYFNPGDWVLVSGDGRTTTPGLREAVLQGLREVGINVCLEERPLPTGASKWLLVTKGLAGAIQITGSHNPANMNGMKIRIGDEALYGERLKALIPVIESQGYRKAVSPGEVREIDALTPYLTMLTRSFEFSEEFKEKVGLVIDPHHGIGGYLTKVLENLGFEVIAINEEPDGTFPKGPADPSKESALQELKEKVKELNSENRSGKTWIGIALDGDADRCGFVDENGNTVSPERMLAVFYEAYIQGLPLEESEKIVLPLDVRASNAALGILTRYGVEGVFVPTGYPTQEAFARLIAPEIGKELPNQIGGEASGHFFFPTAMYDEYGNEVPGGNEIIIDDGLYAALKFLEILDIQKMLPGEMMAQIPYSPTSNEIRITGPEKAEEREKIVETVGYIIRVRFGKELKPIEPLRVVGGIKTQSPESGLVEVAGVRAQFRDGSWLLFRSSGTEPKFTLKFEAPTQEILIKRMRDLKEILIELGFREKDLLLLDEEISR